MTTLPRAGASMTTARAERVGPWGRTRRAWPTGGPPRSAARGSGGRDRTAAPRARATTTPDRTSSPVREMAADTGDEGHAPATDAPDPPPGGRLTGESA